MMIRLMPLFTGLLIGRGALMIIDGNTSDGIFVVVIAAIVNITCFVEVFKQDKVNRVVK